jgi:hypothetical protein
VTSMMITLKAENFCGLSLFIVSFFSNKLMCFKALFYAGGLSASGQSYREISSTVPLGRTAYRARIY